MSSTELWNKLLIRTLLGMVFGMLVGVFFWTAFTDPDYKAGLMLHLLMSGLQGAIPWGGTVVYEIEEWGLLRCTLIHYTLTMLVFVLNSVWLGWFVGTALPIALVIETVVYFLIWLILDLRWKKTISDMNEQLKNFKNQ